MNKEPAKLELHPLCSIFPPMSNAEIFDLGNDIKANGQQDTIVTYEGKILDGQNRYLACLHAGLKPRTMKYTGDDPVAFVISKNLSRRHLNESQRAMLGADILEAAKKLEAEKPTKAAVAKKVSTSAPSLKRAIKVGKKGSAELKRKVREGSISVSKAAKIASLPKPEQAKAIAKPRGGLASVAAAVNGSHPQPPGPRPKAQDGNRQVTVAAVLDVLDEWWNANRRNLNSHPPATPQVVFTQIRSEIAAME